MLAQVQRRGRHAHRQRHRRRGERRALPDDHHRQHAMPAGRGLCQQGWQDHSRIWSGTIRAARASASPAPAQTTGASGWHRHVPACRARVCGGAAMLPGSTRRVVWTPSEACSEACLKRPSQVRRARIELVETAVDSPWASLRRPDAGRRDVQASGSGDNTVLLAIDTVVKAGHAHESRVHQHADGRERGALFGLGADYSEVGRLEAGWMRRSSTARIANHRH